MKFDRAVGAQFIAPDWQFIARDAGNQTDHSRLMKFISTPVCRAETFSHQRGNQRVRFIAPVLFVSHDASVPQEIPPLPQFIACEVWRDDSGLGPIYCARLAIHCP
jgi:hypothetical protein